MLYIMDKVYDNLYKNTADTEEDDDQGKKSIVLGAKKHNNG